MCDLMCDCRQCFWQDAYLLNPLAERCFTIGVFLIGAVIFSVIYGNIAQAAPHR